MSNQPLLELSKIPINVTKFDQAILIWHEAYLSLLTEKGVHIYEFGHNLRCLDKKIDCVQTFISHSKFSPVASLFTEKVINKDFRNIDMTEMIVDHSLWPHNPKLVEEMSTIVDFKWSPVGTVHNHDSAIATLTNIGVVEIHIQEFCNWKCALPISTLLTLAHIVNMNKPNTFDELKNTVHGLATTAMCWSSVLKPDNTCYFVTAQKNGNLLLWHIDCRKENADATLLGSLKSGTSEIAAMLWVQKLGDCFLLICTNVLGEIIVYDCHIQNNTFNVTKMHTIWPDKDRMISKQLQYVENNDKIILAFNKHRHLLIIMIDKEVNILGQYINNINDHTITCINKTDNDLYISTINRKIYKLDLNTSGDDLESNITSIDHGINATIELYGISYSTNKTLCALYTIEKKINSRKDPIKIEISLTSTKDCLDNLLEVLLYNPSKSLTNYWDVIEVLRYKTIKTKVLPPVDFEKLYEMACSDIYMLKVYLILCILCDNLKKIFKLGLNFHLPEDSVDIVKEEILVAHADKLIQKYHEKYKEDGHLSAVDMKYFLGAKKFLEYYFEKNKKNIYEVISPNILSIVDKNTTYTCQSCDSEVTGFICTNEHLNMFCALTFTPIESDKYLACKWCNLTARKELHSENPLCLFCDVNLKYIRN